MSQRTTGLHRQRHWISNETRYCDNSGLALCSETSRGLGHGSKAREQATQDRLRDLKKALLAGVKEFDLEQYRKSESELRSIKNKNIRDFYETQNAKLDDWLDVDMIVLALADDVLDSMDVDADGDGLVDRLGPLQGAGEDLESFLPEEERAKRQKNGHRERLAIKVNVVANIILLSAKIIGLFFTSSLSLVASTTDSALDLLCNLIVWSTATIARWRLPSLQRRFPTGRRRLEPLGVLVFAVIMIVSFIQILEESVIKLLPNGDHQTAQLPPIPIAAMVANAVVKGLIGIWFRSIKTSQVQALVQDCKTDVYFNVTSLLFPLFGNQMNIWWLDPVGAMLLSLYVIYDWAGTSFQNIARLTGASIPARLEKKMMYLAWRFSPVIDSYKTLTTYYTGDGIWVEVDILLKEDTPLPRAHDIAETLQYCYEGLAEVDRAFVTIDYSSLGPSGHANGSG